MAQGPCKNTSCKSFGLAHPNCKCYGSLAKGGEVSDFCSEMRKHDKNCQYFADGSPDSEVSNFDPDAYLDNKTSIPNNSPDQKEDFDPDAYLGAKDQNNFDPDVFLSQENKEEKYGSTNQQLLTGLEGVGEGFVGPAEAALSTIASKFPTESGIPEALKQSGFTPEDISSRQEINPNIHATGELAGLVGGSLTGTGVPGLVAKGAAKASKAFNLGKIGAASLASAIENGTLQGGDEINKSLLGQGDPTHAVSSALANMGAAGLFGAFTGGIRGKISSSLSEAADSKLGTRLNDFLSGFGAGAQGQDIDDVATKAFKAGAKAYSKMDKGLSTIGTATGAYKGYEENGIEGALRGAAEGGLGAHEITKRGIPVLLKLLSTGAVDKAGEALDYANQIDSGLQKTNKAVGSLFGGSAQQLTNDTDAGKKLKDYIKQGGIDQNINESLHQEHLNSIIPNVENDLTANQFAKGGMVKPKSIASIPDIAPVLKEDNTIAENFPDHHIMMETAKGRISNYLKSLQPPDIMPKLAFDNNPDQTQQKKSFNDAIDIANQPLSVIDKIRKGTIEPQHITHLENLYPEVSSMLKQKITQGITQSQISGKKPTFAIRQGMSLLLGTPLSSEMTPQSIQAAQSVFQSQSAQLDNGQPINKNKRNTSTLNKVSGQFLTSAQARSQEAQKVD